MILTIFKSKREKAREAYRQALQRRDEARRRPESYDITKAEALLREAMHARMKVGA